MGLLDNKVCVVTGGAGSVGLASAKAFAREGAKVMIVDLDEAHLKRIADGINSPNIAVHAADVSLTDHVKAYIAATVARWGKIDVLFSNAGNPGQPAPLAEYPEEVFDRTLLIHVKGAFLACKYGIPNMNKGGSIIITSSVAGVRGGNGLNLAYVAAKHAQIGVMRAVARAAAPLDIRVNSLNPGPVDNAFQTTIEKGITKITGIDATELFNSQTPLGRHASADEIANVALFLSSPMSSFVTGAVLMADGGMTS